MLQFGHLSGAIGKNSSSSLFSIKQGNRETLEMKLLALHYTSQSYQVNLHP